MRTIILISILLTVTYAIEMGNTTQFVMPLKNDVPVYKNDIRKLNEKPLFKMNINDRYMIVATSTNHIKIKNNDGYNGWVEKRLIKKVKASSAHIFDSKLIETYVDNPTPIIIEGNKDFNDTLIIEGRSFAENIRENIDRETVERMK